MGFKSFFKNLGITAGKGAISAGLQYTIAQTGPLAPLVQSIITSIAINNREIISQDVFDAFAILGVRNYTTAQIELFAQMLNDIGRKVK
jgi:hypothetical protein